MFDIGCVTDLPTWWPSDKPWIIGDCIDGMKALPDKCVDLIVTDPPYGVGMDYGDTYADTENNWYDLIYNFYVQARRISKMVVFPSCQIKRMKWVYDTIPPDWLICWHKGSPGTAGFLGFNDWEPLLVYGKGDGVVMHDHFFCQPQEFDNGHPCPKPVGFYTWIIERTTVEGGIVLDPFLGSGTALQATRRTDRIGLGFEINPKYESIIRKRSLYDVRYVEDYV